MFPKATIKNNIRNGLASNGLHHIDPI
jgi:hypothetical protein